jgi:hypothetical protein
MNRDRVTRLELVPPKDRGVLSLIEQAQSIISEAYRKGPEWQQIHVALPLALTLLETAKTTLIKTVSGKSNGE